MEYSVTDYFEADINLKKAILEIGRLSHSPRKAALYAAKERMKIAAHKVDELIEIFTWETKNTDHIRRAFITLAIGIEQQLADIRNSGYFPDLYNGSNNQHQLMEDISNGFYDALKSTGRFQPYITIRKSHTEWDADCLIAYAQDMQRQLKYATFDNLLEAVTYFEKSTLLLQSYLQSSPVKTTINKYII